MNASRLRFQMGQCEMTESRLWNFGRKAQRLIETERANAAQPGLCRNPHMRLLTEIYLQDLEQLQGEIDIALSFAA